MFYGKHTSTFPDLAPMQESPLNRPALHRLDITATQHFSDGLSELSAEKSAVSFLFSSVRKTFEKCLATMGRKNADYAKPENEWANFEGCLRIGVPVQTGMMVRLQDKFSRLENLMTKPPAVVGESITDTIEDAICYLAILKARIDFDQQNG